MCEYTPFSRAAAGATSPSSLGTPGLGTPDLASPAAHCRFVPRWKFFGGCREIISQHRQINTPFLPKLVRHVETILIQRMATRRK